jgi:hypothetical protein
MKTEAQADLSRRIRVQISAQSHNKISAVSSNGQYAESESFISQSSAESRVEVANVKVESYYDPESKSVYAFAFINRYELIGYYKNHLSITLTQAEGVLQTAQDLEANAEKSKAREQCDAVPPLLEKVRQAQELLAAIDPTASDEELQQTKTERLYNTLTQMSARLAQAIYVYVESEEDLFGASVNIVANKLKSVLASNGCSFVEDPAEADFLLTITVTTRITSDSGTIVFCYADASIDLYDMHKQKTVYSNEIAQKGGSNTQDKAGRKAMDDLAPKIAETIQTWIK